MEPEDPRMRMFREEFCDHAADLHLHIAGIFRHLLPENVESLCRNYFENEASARQYLCAFGVPRQQVRDYLGVAAKMFILCATYTNITLTEACCRLAEDSAKNGLDPTVLVGLASLRGVMFALEPSLDEMEGEKLVVGGPCGRPAEPKPVSVPVPQVPECVAVERENVAAARLRAAEAKIRSRLLISSKNNMCCNSLGRVETSVSPRVDGSYFAYAEFVCSVCGKVLSSVSEVYRI